MMAESEQMDLWAERKRASEAELQLKQARAPRFYRGPQYAIVLNADPADMESTESMRPWAAYKLGTGVYYLRCRPGAQHLMEQMLMNDGYASQTDLDFS